MLSHILRSLVLSKETWLFMHSVLRLEMSFEFYDYTFEVFFIFLFRKLNCFLRHFLLLRPYNILMKLFELALFPYKTFESLASSGEIQNIKWWGLKFSFVFFFFSFFNWITSSHYALFLYLGSFISGFLTHDTGTHLFGG